MNQDRIISGKRTVRGILEAYYRELAEQPNQDTNGDEYQDTQDKGSKDFSLTQTPEYFRISPVPLRDGIYEFDFRKALAPNSTQDELAEARIQALKTGGFYAPSYPEFHAVINTLHKNREGPLKDEVKEARILISDLINGKWLNLLTRIAFNPDGSAVFTHSYKQPDSYTIKVNNFEGPNGDITATRNTEEFMQVLLDTNQTPQEIDQVYRWLRELPSNVYRINSKPRNIEERVAWFFAGSGRSNFFCDRHVDNSDSSPWVRAQKIE